MNLNLNLLPVSMSSQSKFPSPRNFVGGAA